MQTDKQDPEYIDISEVIPDPALGSNFNYKSLNMITLSTKSVIWGTDNHTTGMEPHGDAFTPELKKEILLKDNYRCSFCGFYSSKNDIHNISDNHIDINIENLQTIDPICHGWQHLGELPKDMAVIAYIPGLSGQDVNHLQRTIYIALNSNDDATVKDAKELLNWLASHKTYTENLWGTSSPEIFATAILKLSDENKEKRQVAFKDLSVVFDSLFYKDHVSTWQIEAYSQFPTKDWKLIYHNIINAPA